jgi:hypothetical protein
MRVLDKIPLIALCCALAAISANAPARAENACTKLISLKVPGYDVTIQHADMVSGGPVPAGRFQPSFNGNLPAYCRADGSIDSRTGRDGKPYAIRFAVAMPDNWNGRFLMQGGAGYNGQVGQPFGVVAAGEVPALARGFSVVTTDSGHQSEAIFDDAFFSDQEATLNFLYEAVGKVAQVGKQVVRGYYGKAVAHSYFMGCSTGGREAMVMTQRYPRYFDGVVAGAPAMRTNFSNLADTWVEVALNQAAPTDEQGRPIGARALSETDKKLVVDSFLQACDANDGLADGMVFDPAGCHFNPANLVCKTNQKTSACLTAAQAAALTKGFGGPINSRGRQVYPGFWYDTGITATTPVAGLLNPGSRPVAGPNYDLQMDVDGKEILANTPSAEVGDTAHWTQLDSFSGHGGKLIFFHGVSDPWFSARETTRYYEQMVADNGGAKTVANWSQLYLVPGMGHCGGGSVTLDRFDLIDPIVNWVEKGEAPRSVTATGKMYPGRSRPLCPYPQHAHYKGSGDSERAESFECRNPS